jgi:hypothetical protein
MVKVGIIGVSTATIPQIGSYADLDNIHIVGYTTEDGKDVKKISHSLGRLMPMEELIQHVDAVLCFDTTPTVQEISHTLRQGKPIFLSHFSHLQPTDLEQIASVSDEANTLCMLNLNARYNPALDVVKSEAHQPLFIETHREWIYDPSHAQQMSMANSLLEDIDLIGSLVQSELKRVAATGVKVIGDEVDITNARLEFANGCVANLTANRIGMTNEHHVKVFLPQHYYVCNLEENKADKIYFKPHHEQAGSGLIAAIAEGRDGLLAMEHLPLVSDSVRKQNAFDKFLHLVKNKEMDLSGIYKAKWALETMAKLHKRINSLGDEY